MKQTVAIAFVGFVGVFAAVLSGAAIVGIATDESPETAVAPDVTDLNNDQYDTDQFDIEVTPGEADIRMDSTTSDRNVLIHTGAGVLDRDLQPIVNALTENGHDVTVIGGGVSLPPGVPPSQVSVADEQEETVAGELEGAHAYAAIGVQSYDDEEVEALEEFVEDDGRVLLTTDPQQSFTTSEGVVELQSRLDIATEPGYVYNLEENDLNYQRVFVEPDGTSALTAGVDRAVFDTATPVDGPAGSERLRVIDGSELSTTRERADAATLIRTDNVVFAGDTDFLSPENALRADNDRLIGNIADFLVTGDREPDPGDETDDEVDAAFQAVSTGGFFQTDETNEEAARQQGLQFLPDELVITGDIGNDTWESTDVSFDSPQADGFDIEAPDGLSGELDIEGDRLTVEGELVFTLLDDSFGFEMAATTVTSGDLTGEATLDTDGGSATVVDNEFIIDDTTGDADVDAELGLPSTDPGLNWLELELELTLDPGAL